MKKNENMVGDCNCDQFYQVKVYTRRDEDCTECLQIGLSCRPYLRPVEKTKDHQLHTSQTVQHAVLIHFKTLFFSCTGESSGEAYSNLERTTALETCFNEQLLIP